MSVGSLSDKTQEYLLLAFFLIPTGYMFIESLDFASRVGLFPQLSAIGVVIFSLLVVLEKYIPDYLIPESDESDSNNSADEVTPADEIQTQTVEESEPQKNVKRGLDLSIWSGSYLFTSYLFGFLWTTPIFVLTYCYMRDLSIIEAVTLSFISIAIAYAFMTVTRVPIDEGIFTVYSLTN